MVSNNTLAALIIVAIIISVAGILTTFRIQLPITGAATGTTNVTVATTTTISLPVNTIDFGTMYTYDTNDTSDGSPPPFQVQNDGNVNVNITVSATSLWSMTGYTNNTDHYQGKCRSYDVGSCGSGSITTYTNLSDSAVVFIANMPYAAANDTAYFDINVTVPPEEQAGAKSSTVTFTASQA